MIIHAATKIVYLADPKVRDWITIIKTISAASKTIPAMLILSGLSMLQKHFNNNLDNNTLFKITHSGYSNAIFSVEYIKHFNKITAKLVVKKYKILIFDSTGSYMSD
jgi:hypothetical protein